MNVYYYLVHVRQKTLDIVLQSVENKNYKLDSPQLNGGMNTYYTWFSETKLNKEAIGKIVIDLEEKELGKIIKEKTEEAGELIQYISRVNDMRLRLPSLELLHEDLTT